MTHRPKIELRNIKHTAWASEETHCYQASLYVDGERWGIVSNQGYGGCDDFHGEGGRDYGDIRKLDRRIAETYPPYTFGEGDSLAQNLELICAELVNQWLQDREFAKAMKGKVLFTKPGVAGVWQIPVPKSQPMRTVLDAMKAKHPAFTYLSDLPVGEAKALYFSA